MLTELKRKREDASLIRFDESGGSDGSSTVTGGIGCRSSMEFLQNFKNNQAYSDLTITCQSQKWHAHRVIACSQSTYFKAACDKPCRVTDALTLTSQSFSHSPQRDPQENFTYLVRFNGEDPKLVESMVTYFYTHDYEASSRKVYDILHQATEIYAFAERYGIWGLKACCLSKVSLVLRDCAFEEEAFFRCAKLAWTKAPDLDRDLRDLYVAYLRRVRHKVSNRKGLIEKLRKMSGLAVDIVAAEWA